MRNIFTSVLLLLAFQVARAQFTYINPMPGTGNHNPETNILLKCGKWINKQSVQSGNLLTITGSLSGNHEFTARLSDDHKTVVIKPVVKFTCNETVTVTVNSKLHYVDGNQINGTSFSFGIRKEITPEDAKRNFEVRRQSFIEEYGYDPWKKTQITRGPQDSIIYLDSMPHYTINVNDTAKAWNAQIFFTNHEDAIGNIVFTNSFTTIINNNGTIVWARDVGKEGHDFKINANGYLTYFVTLEDMWMIMDSEFNIIDSVQCKNGYETSTNEHDLMMYPDGHVFLIAYDNETTDMTAYGGQPDAKVQYCVLQELDSARDVVFEWRSNDPGHFLFTDANQYTSLTNSTVDYVHCNTIWRDSTDGNIVISCRNMDEVTKINEQTGDIIWRWGGENNQFTFINDNNAKHFASQHDVQRIANGHFTMMNNANHMVPQRSGAKEYAVDEVNKTATLKWYYEHPDVNGFKVYGSATGSVQRLPNGNTMIDWGLIQWGVGIPNQTEVDSVGNIVWEMTWDSVGQKSYRVHKYQWNPCTKLPYYADADGDGYGSQVMIGKACNAPAGYVHDSTDCNDTDATVHPGAGENCLNGIDDNCNGVIDEGTAVTYYVDADADSYGDASDPGSLLCSDPGAGYSTNNTDCNDSNANINPAASEICNNIDDNCNGSIDEGLPIFISYADADGDTYGDANNMLSYCMIPTGYVEDSSDCDDTNPNINPAAIEIPNNGIDDNCNGYVDEFGTEVPSSVSDEYNLSVFPNPFSSFSVISFSLQQPMHISIVLYDLAGRKLETLIDENLVAGNHEIVLNRDNLSSGIYLLQLKLNDKTLTKKAVIE